MSKRRFRRYARGGRMKVRRLDRNGDWCYGNSINDYLIQKDAIVQNIKTRLKEYLGDCFWSLNSGIAWDIRLGQTNQEELLKSDTYSIIKDTSGVVSILEHSPVIKNRRANIKTLVDTIYGRETIEVQNGR